MNHTTSTTHGGPYAACPARPIAVELPLSTIEELDHLASLHHLSRQDILWQIINAGLASDTPHCPAGRDPAGRLAARAHLTLVRSFELAADRTPAMSATATRTAPLPRPLIIRDSPEDIAALWAMTPAERVEAMWNGQLTMSQLSAWTSRAQHEVPLLGGELAWIVMRTPEWDEDTDTPHTRPQNNVVHLPTRSEHRAAA